MTGTKLQIADQEIGNGLPTLIIAEIAQAHDGSLGSAHAFVDAAADADATDVADTDTVAEGAEPREPTADA